MTKCHFVNFQFFKIFETQLRNNTNFHKCKKIYFLDILTSYRISQLDLAKGGGGFDSGLIFCVIAFCSPFCYCFLFAIFAYLSVFFWSREGIITTVQSFNWKQRRMELGLLCVRRSSLCFAPPKGRWTLQQWSVRAPGKWLPRPAVFKVGKLEYYNHWCPANLGCFTKVCLVLIYNNICAILNIPIPQYLTIQLFVWWIKKKKQIANITTVCAQLFSCFCEFGS